MNNQVAVFIQGLRGEQPAVVMLYVSLKLAGMSLALSMLELMSYTGRSEDALSQAMIGLMGKGMFVKQTGQHGKIIYLPISETFDALFPASGVRADSTLSSSSIKEIKELKEFNSIITTTTLFPDSGVTADSDFSPLPPDSVDDVAQIRRILAATPKLFGEPGVFTKGLHLEALRIDDLLGWLMEAMNADNLPLRSRAGVAYNGLKRGERPAVGYQNVEHDKFPHDFLVEIGERKKQCVLCQEEFDSLAEHDAHWKICVNTPKPEPEEEPDCVLEPWGLPDEHPGQAAWGAVLSFLKNDMPRASFETWVRDTRAVEWRKDERVLVIGARNTYACDWLTSHLSSTANRLIGNRMDGECQVRFCVIPGGG